MDRIKSLNRYQKSILIFMAIIILVFTIIYPRVISRVGYEYKNTILITGQENTNTVYSGEIRGKQAVFTVFDDNTVSFRHGDKIYGTYTVKEDSTAIPKDEELSQNMTGLELRRDDEILFRGGMLRLSDGILWLYNENGDIENIRITAVVNGVEIDEHGNVIDPMEPAASDILDLLYGTEMTHKGEWPAWFLGVLLCIITALSVLFADELFRFRMSFRIYNSEDVEPSELEIAGRYIGWTVTAVIAMLIFITGLR